MRRRGKRSLTRRTSLTYSRRKCNHKVLEKHMPEMRLRQRRRKDHETTGSHGQTSSQPVSTAQKSSGNAEQRPVSSDTLKSDGLVKAYARFGVQSVMRLVTWCSMAHHWSEIRVIYNTSSSDWRLSIYGERGCCPSHSFYHDSH